MNYAAKMLGLIALAAPLSVQAQDLLGVFAPGSRIEVNIGTTIAPTLLKVLIDGQEVEAGWELVGNRLQVVLPNNLSGRRHDLVLVLEKPGQSEVVGSWVFDTPSKDREVSVSLLLEAGRMRSASTMDEYASSSGRLDFGIGDGRFIGGLSFGFPDAAGIPSPAELSIFDLYLEYRDSVFGDEFHTRLGTHYIYNDTGLIDDATRRGLSFRLDDLGARYQIAAFALAPPVQEGTENLSGLEDPENLVFGGYGYIQPFAGNSVRLSFAGYQGKSAETPDGIAGEGIGYGATVSGPMVNGRMDYAIGMEITDWETADGERAGNAIRASFDYEFLPEEQRNLGLYLDLRWIDQGYYSFLNPSEIVGERGASIGLHYYAPEWQWQVDLGYTETNYNGDPNAATDTLGELSAQLFYLPDDFTGGFLNGTTFYALADILSQDRLITPAGAPDPQDNTFYSFVVGFDKFYRNHSYALSYRHDILDDRTVLDEDELARRVEFLYTVNPSERFELGFSSEIGHLINSDGSYWDGGLGLSIMYELVSDILTSETEFGFREFENPALTDGLYFTQSLLWEFAEGHSFILSTQYGSGTEVHDLVDVDEGWVFGVALRSEIGFSRIR